MDKLFELFKKVARLLTIIGLFTAAGYVFLSYVMAIGGGFLPVITEIILMVVLVALYALPAVLLLLKKEAEAKFAFGILVAYWFVENMINYTASGTGINSYNQGMNIAVDVFELILGLTLLVVYALFMLTKILKLKFFWLLRIILLCSLALFVLVFIMNFIDCIVDEDPWLSYIGTLVFDCIFPVGAIAGLFYFFDEASDKGSKEAPKEE